MICGAIGHWDGVMIVFFFGLVQACYFFLLSFKQLSKVLTVQRGLYVHCSIAKPKKKMPASCFLFFKKTVIDVKKGEKNPLSPLLNINSVS